MTDLQDTPATIDHMYSNLKNGCVCVTKASVANQSLTTDPELWTLVKRNKSTRQEVEEWGMKLKRGGRGGVIFLFSLVLLLLLAEEADFVI